MIDPWVTTLSLAGGFALLGWAAVQLYLIFTAPAGPRFDRRPLTTRQATKEQMPQDTETEMA